MSLIKKSTELSIPSTVKIMIYGQAGSGKTTLALSSPKPLLLDFDGGVKRINLNHLKNVDSVQVSSWKDIKQVMQDDLSAYESIIVDTVGKMMDFIIIDRCGVRQPYLKDWSGINQEFLWFTRALSSLNKNIIFVAHRDTRKEGDDTVFIPSLREKSYNSIVTELDLLGYLEMKTEHGKQIRKITFDPTSRNDGKNTCNLPSEISLPVILNSKGEPSEKNNFIESKIIEPYITMLKQKQEEMSMYDAVMKEIKESIDEITDDTSANNFIERINDFNHIGSSKISAAILLKEKAKKIGLTLNSKTKKYEISKKDNPSLL